MTPDLLLNTVTQSHSYFYAAFALFLEDSGCDAVLGAGWTDASEEGDWTADNTLHAHKKAYWEISEQLRLIYCS